MGTPPCHLCGRILASPAGLRRHINSQHQQSEYHECEHCGKRFLDPAGRSRCRAGHSKSFGCPAPNCDYRSNRKDSAKQHIRRRHPDLVGHAVLSLPPTTESSSPSSSDAGSGLDSSPSPAPMLVTPPILQPLQDFTDLWPPEPTFYYTENQPQDWPPYEPN
ncbi:hypothetical protein M407DRAFT_100026 [Tulasnella calospora MUT 4182]|uniref:C2H2-type domain-containing protein n=1 Tax=Tulasnella calospora MUT 4182 TaxID=1051891 RepID=A0A0C3QGB4_9AGAM|nr:hypothetical protein M407DRAFT_100026 [Tulasnella calospora MUT 4182]